MHATNSRSTGSRRSCEPRPQIVPVGQDRDRTESPVNTSTSSAPVTARRVILPGLVEPEGLMIESGPVDAPGPGQLLVAVEATGISYAEQAMRRGRYFGQPEFPFVPGYDLVGTVLQTGPQADTSMAGKRVAVLTKTGDWASHAGVGARDTDSVPAGFDRDDDACSLRAAGHTRGLCLVRHHRGGQRHRRLGDAVRQSPQPGAAVERAAERAPGEVLRSVGRAQEPAGPVPQAPRRRPRTRVHAAR